MLIKEINNWLFFRLKNGRSSLNIKGICTMLFFLVFCIIGNGFLYYWECCNHDQIVGEKKVLHGCFHRFFSGFFFFLDLPFPFPLSSSDNTNSSLSPPCFRFRSDRCGRGGGGISGSSSSLSLSIGGIYEDRLGDGAAAAAPAPGLLGCDPLVDAPSLSESSSRRLAKFRLAFTYVLVVRGSWLLHWPVKKRCIPGIVGFFLKVETSLAVPTTRSAYWLGFVSSVLTTP